MYDFAMELQSKTKEKCKVKNSVKIEKQLKRGKREDEETIERNKIENKKMKIPKQEDVETGTKIDSSGH